MCLAVPGQILSINGADLARVGRVEFGGIVKEINLALVPEAGVGDYVIVHAGVAINRLDEDAAADTLAELRWLAELCEESPSEH